MPGRGESPLSGQLARQRRTERRPHRCTKIARAALVPTGAEAPVLKKEISASTLSLSACGARNFMKTLYDGVPPPHNGNIVFDSLVDSVINLRGVFDPPHIPGACGEPQLREPRNKLPLSKKTAFNAPSGSFKISPGGRGIGDEGFSRLEQYLSRWTIVRVHSASAGVLPVRIALVSDIHGNLPAFEVAPLADENEYIVEPRMLRRVTIRG